MKKVFVLFSMFAIMMAGYSAFAQEGEHHCQHQGQEGHKCSHQCQQPKILTENTVTMLKEEFFKANLKLNDNQKDAFWKSYNKYETAKKQAKENAHAAMKKAGLPEHACAMADKAQFTPDQKVALHNIQLDARQAKLSAEQTFYKELAKNLNNEQIAQYMQLEKLFQMQMAKMNKGEACGHNGGCQGHGDAHAKDAHHCMGNQPAHKCNHNPAVEKKVEK